MRLLETSRMRSLGAIRVHYTVFRWGDGPISPNVFIFHFHWVRCSTIFSHFYMKAQES